MKKMLVVFTIVFVSIVSAASVSGQNMFRKVNDFDGDGKADFAVTRSGGDGLMYWWIWQTTGGPKVTQWGIYTDLPAAGDYDGDGKSDTAVWRPATTNGNLSTYYILESQSNTFRFHSFYNFIVSEMMHQDYNGDGRTDPAVRTGETNITISGVYSGSNSRFGITFPPNHFFGYRIGDMDGDGRADRVTSIPSSNLITLKITNLETNVSRDVQFGVASDQYQLADFDGDGIGDLTIFRDSDGTWWWLRSSDNVVNIATWGQSGDTPVPADYDGDGKTDLAIYRRGSQSVYWIKGSQNGVMSVPWGTFNDRAVTY